MGCGAEDTTEEQTSRPEEPVDTSVTLVSSRVPLAGITTLPTLPADDLALAEQMPAPCIRPEVPRPLPDVTEPYLVGSVEGFNVQPSRLMASAWEAKLRRVSRPASTPDVPALTPMAASDIVQLGFGSLNVTSKVASDPLRGEPTAAAAGKFWMMTGNLYAAVSQNEGSTWSFLDLNQFPVSTNTNGGICCDQTVVYVPSHDLFVWQMQYKSNTTKTSNAWRIAAAKASELGKPASNINWCSWEITPTQAGVSGSGSFLDRPDFALGKDYLWYSARVFTLLADGKPGLPFKGSTVMALSLNELRNCGSLALNPSVQAEEVTALAQGAGSTMRWVTRLNNTSLKLRSRSESLGAVTAPTTVSHASSPSASPSCLAANGSDLCVKASGATVAWFSGGKLGVLWTAPQGTGGLGTFAYPYIQEAIFDTANLAAPAQNRHVFSPTGTYMFPSVGVNARGHRAGSLVYMDNGSYPEPSVWLDDDLGSMGSSISTFSLSTGAVAGGWGDYFSSQRHNTSSTTWLATSQLQTSSQSFFHQSIWFGRDRDFVDPLSSRLAVYRPSATQFYVDYNGNGIFDPPGDHTLTFGSSNAVPLAGDLIGNGAYRVATFRNVGGQGQWNLDLNGTGVPDTGDTSFVFGDGTDRPVLGRWTSSDRKARIGTFRPSTACWYLDTNGTGAWDGGDTSTCQFGTGTSTPIVGDWNGDGVDDIGTFVGVGASGYFNLDYNGNRVWDGCVIDRCYQFGAASDRPVVGDWNGSGTSKVGVARGNGAGALDFYLDNGNGTWGAGDWTKGNYGYSSDVPLAGVW